MPDPFTPLPFSADGQCFITGSGTLTPSTETGALRVFLTSGGKERACSFHQGVVTEVAIGPDCRSVATAGAMVRGPDGGPQAFARVFEIGQPRHRSTSTRFLDSVIQWRRQAFGDWSRR